MKLNDIISMVKDTTQKIGEKKTLKIKDIVLIPEAFSYGSRCFGKDAGINERRRF